MGFTVTFYTHFGASLFVRRTAEEFSGIRLAPVPRCLSASCGVCAELPAPAERAETVSARVRALAESCEIEALYLHREEGRYERLLGFD